MRASAMAAPSPRRVDTIAAAAAILALVRMAGMYVGSCRPALNQHVVNPFHTVTLPTWLGGRSQTLEPVNPCSAAAEGLLNAKSTITAIGRDRKAKTTAAQAVKARLAVTILRLLGTEALLLRREQYVERDEPRQRDHQADRHRRPERLVLGRGELVADHVADELVVTATEDVRDDVLPRHRDEDQQRSRDRSREGEPQGDLAEGAERRLAEIGGGLDQRPVHPFQRREDRDDEQRQVVVDQPDRDGVLGVHDVDPEVLRQVAVGVEDDLQRVGTDQE